MKICIKDENDKNDFLTRSKMVLTKAESLLFNYGILDYDLASTPKYENTEVEIVFNRTMFKDNGDRELGKLEIIDDVHYCIILNYELIFLLISDFPQKCDNEFQTILAREFFKIIYRYVSMYESSSKREGLDNILINADIFECLFASFIGYTEHVKNKFKSVERQNNNKNNM